MAFDTVLQWLTHHVEVLVAILSAIVAVIGALLSRAETRKQREVHEENLRHAVDAQSLAWGNTCIDVLVKVAIFARTRQHHQNDASFLQQRVNLMLAVSSLVERGRLFFPNVDPDGKGAEKEGAYRGTRPPILDALMYVYYELDALTRTDGPTAKNSGDFVDECRRLVVSELQAHIDPRRRDTLMGRYDDQRLDHRTDALKRAEGLKAKLKTRRPGLDFGERIERPQ